MKITVSAGKCVGCRICELACSFRHEKVFGTGHSRVRVSKLEERGLDLPHLCRQCKNHPCVSACPVEALSVNTDTGAVQLTGTCTGCGACVAACPFGAANLHPETAEVLICDLCDGSPACVAECPTGALTLGQGDRVFEINLAAAKKREKLADKEAADLLREWGVGR